MNELSWSYCSLLMSFMLLFSVTFLFGALYVNLIHSPKMINLSFFSLDLY